MAALEGKTILVTGASSGIGRATCARCLADGAQVVGADIGPPPDLAGSFRFQRTDVTDEVAVAELVAMAAAVTGRLDGTVHAAGVAGGGAVHALALEEWDRVISINLTGTFLVAKHVLGQMLEQPLVDGARGSLVTLASIEGLEGTAGGSAYSASKGGVVLLTKNMAIDYAARGIRVNALCPGFIETPMTDGIFGLPGMEEALVDLIDEHKMRRMGQPEEIAAVAAFLLSADASFITGHALPVDGGYTAGRDHGVTRLMGLGPD
jgi:NAD(P)-dependent dehydrogenase (short-subunit alcohol dehydrogenase family)